MIDVETGVILNNEYIMLGYNLENGLASLDNLHTRNLLYMFFVFNDTKYLKVILDDLKENIMVGDLSLKQSPQYIWNILLEDIEIKKTGKCNDTQFKKYCLKANILGSSIYTREQIVDYLKEVCRRNENLYKKNLGKDIEMFFNSIINDNMKLSNIDNFKRIAPHIVIKKENYDKNGLDIVTLFKDYLSLNLRL